MKRQPITVMNKKPLSDIYGTYLQFAVNLGFILLIAGFLLYLFAIPVRLIPEQRITDIWLMPATEQTMEGETDNALFFESLTAENLSSASLRYMALITPFGFILLFLFSLLHRKWIYLIITLLQIILLFFVIV